VLAQLEESRHNLADAVTALLGIAIVVGSAMLWIAIPFGGLWLVGELTSRAQGFLFATLGGIPLAMTAAAWFLYRVNDGYERSRAGEAGAGRRAPRALIDVPMTISATVALVLMAIWFFFYSHMWLVTPL